MPVAFPMRRVGVLVEDRPGDLALAWDALEALGPAVMKGVSSR